MKNTLILLLLIAQISALSVAEDFSLNAKIINASSAENYKQGEDFAKKMLSKSKLDLEKTFAEVKDLQMLLSNIPVGEGDGCKDCGTKVQNISNKEADIDNGTIVFISFSMPNIAIKELCDNAIKYGATVVLRGLHGDSFLKTKDKILEINKNGLSLLMHPDLFKQYNVQRVPTFVLVKDSKEVARLTGNVTLEFAASKLEEAT